jgi:N-acetylglucosamine kinase-like BadF-type ATPase
MWLVESEKQIPPLRFGWTTREKGIRLAYFVGLDSGGTKTECWLGDEARVLGKAVARTVKLTRVSQEIATARLRELLTEVSTQAGVPLSAVTRTCVGVAGYSITEVREWAERVVGQMVAGEVTVCGDDEIALDAAFRGGAGILVIGGTGSAVLGRCADGKRYKAGGWGPGIGDEGSGFWIGREAVRRAFAAVDGGEETTLLEAIRTAWGVKDVGGVVAYANALPGPDFAALTPVVMRCAEDGDGVAQRVLEDAGDELARQVCVVWEKMQAHDEKQAQVAYTGSVVEKIATTREAMRQGIARRCEGLTMVDGAVNSMDGAMWRARRAG